MIATELLNRGVEIPRALGRVLVSGGNSGLGRAIVDAVHAAGGSAVSLDVRGGRPGDMVVDVADRRAVSAAIDEVASRYGEITAVVTSAGVDACGPFGQVDAGEWERVIGVNLLGTASIVRAALPYLERSRGHIVTVASTLGLRAVSDATAYCASKFGVIGFSRALAVELKDRVKLTCLIPGGMHTNFFEGRTEQYKPPADARLNDPKHVADAVVFALSQPPECEIREMVVCPSAESSWP